eukprot:m.1131742 g.1131742  ORF g.1131742 m.1131742 type:complete len:589 (-) comp24424_c3_seq52:2098-3864(-)
MMAARHSEEIGNEPHFDFIVIGAGSAGATCAARLCEDGLNTVLLLEAGRCPSEDINMPLICGTLQHTISDWDFTASPGHVLRPGLPGGVMSASAGKCLGGSSCLNHMVYARGTPENYDEWERLGATGWSYEDCLPYFKKSERASFAGDAVVEHDVHGTTGSVATCSRTLPLRSTTAFLMACIDAGAVQGDYNGRGPFPPGGVAAHTQYTINKGHRCSTFKAFLEESADKHTNLSITTDALVTGVQFSDDAIPKAVSVSYSVGGVQRKAYATKEIILSAGAYGTPKLLMLSGVGDRQHLQTHGIDTVVHNPHVGLHLKDHLVTPLLVVDTPGSLSMEAFGTAVGMGEDKSVLEKYLSSGVGPQETSLADGMWLFNADPPSSADAVAQGMNAQVMFTSTGLNADIWKSVFRVCDIEGLLGDPATVFAPTRCNALALPNNVQPKSEGSVRLGSSDPAAPPVIDFNYLSHPDDVATQIKILRRTAQVFDTPSWKAYGGSVQIPPKLAAKHGTDLSNEGLLHDMVVHMSRTLYHPACTCRMGSVVDAQLRVLGVQGLRIADASVMPNITSGNLNAPCIMIGERCADFLRKDHL